MCIDADTIYRLRISNEYIKEKSEEQQKLAAQLEVLTPHELLVHSAMTLISAPGSNPWQTRSGSSQWQNGGNCGRRDCHRNDGESRRGGCARAKTAFNCR